MSFRFRLNCEFLEQRDNPSGLDPVDSTGTPVDPTTTTTTTTTAPPAPTSTDTSGTPKG